MFNLRKTKKDMLMKAIKRVSKEIVKGKDTTVREDKLRKMLSDITSLKELFLYIYDVEDENIKITLGVNSVKFLCDGKEKTYTFPYSNFSEYENYDALIDAIMSFNNVVSNDDILELKENISKIYAEIEILKKNNKKEKDNE